MKPRLFACIAVSMVVVCAFALSARIALAQGGQEAQPQKSEQDKGKSGDHSSDIDKALKAYDERMDKCIDKSRQELDQMKKDLHELIDMRINMAVALAELRAKNAPGGAYGPSGAGYPRGSGEPGRKHQEGGVENAGLSRELQQIHNQIRSEIDQQENQVAQLASQIRAMKEQGQEAPQSQQRQQPGSNRQPPQSPQRYQGTSGSGRDPNQK
jgi:hypothetical protein